MKAMQCLRTGGGGLADVNGGRGGHQAGEEEGAERVIRVQRRALSRQVLAASRYAVVDLQVQGLGLLPRSAGKEGSRRKNEQMKHFGKRDGRTKDWSFK